MDLSVVSAAVGAAGTVSPVCRVVVASPGPAGSLWPVLVTATATLTAALGAVRATRRGEDTRHRDDVRREAYADLVAAVNAALGFYDQRPGLLPDYMSGLSVAKAGTEAAVRVNSRTDELMTDLRQAVSLVQITGSDRAAAAAVVISDAAHGSVNSHLAWDRVSGFKWGWVESLTGAGVEHLHTALDDFIRITRAELNRDRARWRRLIPRRGRAVTPAPEPVQVG